MKEQTHPSTKKIINTLPLTAKPFTPTKCRLCSEAEVDRLIEYRGQTVPACKPCSQSIRRQKQRKLTQARIEKVIPPRYRDARIEQLPEGFADLFASLDDDKGIYLWGSQGVGKTHAVCALAHYFITNGLKVRIVRYSDLCMELRRCFDGRSERSEGQIIEGYCSVDKLIIDDLGTSVRATGRQSDFRVAVMLQITDKRLRDCRATYITNNKPMEYVEKEFDPTLASRLNEACEIVKLTGSDRRRQNSG